jgi:hypothetical protein
MSQKSPSITSWEFESSSEYEYKYMTVSISYPKCKRGQISRDALSIMELLYVPNESEYSYDIETETVSVGPRLVTDGHIVNGYTLTLYTSVKYNDALSVVREFIKQD